MLDGLSKWTYKGTPSHGGFHTFKDVTTIKLFKSFGDYSYLSNTRET